MIKIGIGNTRDSLFTKDMIVALSSLTEFKTKVMFLNDYNDNKNTLDKDIDILILIIKGDSKLIDESFNILVINDENNYIHQNHFIETMTWENYLVIDSDNIELMKSLSVINGYLVTCGFNQKSTITTSSVIENEYKTVQVCIQRSFKTISNKEINQQEFSINVKGVESNIFNILSAVACILICGIEI